MKMNDTEHRGMIYIILGGLLILLVWASLFDLEQTVRATGQVVTKTRTQIVQAADGGVISELKVLEGDRVSKGQLLASLESDRALAGVDEGLAKVAALSAALRRAQAQAKGTKLVFTSEENAYPSIVSEQLALFKQATESMKAERETWESALIIAKEELEINESLFETGDASRLDVIRARRQVVEMQGKLEGITNDYKQKAREEITKLQQDLISEQYQLQDKQNRLKHTDLVAPVDGVVKSLRVDTIGGVLRAGDELLQISPSDSELFVDAKINPADVGLLELGYPVEIKIDAFDYTIYGGLRGELTYISSDTLTESTEKNSSVYYKAMIKVDNASINPKIDVDELKPGMTASVDIKTGSRSVLLYIMKPIARAFQGAGSER